MYSMTSKNIHQSVRFRFVFTFGATLFRSLLNFTTGMLLARWLGPEAYGKMAFLLGTFLGVKQLLDMGSSSAFFTFLSQRPRSRSFVLLFFAWVGVQFAVPLVIVGLVFPDIWVSYVWHGEDRNLILLVFVATFMQYSLWPIVQQMGESQRRTVLVQAVGVVVAVVHLCAITTIWIYDFLGLHAVFGAIAVEYLFASIMAVKGHSFSDSDTGNREAFGSIVRHYVRYCLPLIPYSWLGFAYEFFDRWMLQSFGGSVEQAYYTVGAQFAAVALLATTSILRIFWKEVAEAYQEKNLARIKTLYSKISRFLFIIGAALAGFAIPWAKDVVYLVLGPAYVEGAATLAIMFLYPVHQSMGQVGGAMLYATERISIQVIIGIGFMATSMVVSYFVLAPEIGLVPGLGLGSEGLALKMVVMQFIQVNIIAYIIARIWNWQFDWGFQLIGLLVCVSIGWSAHAITLTVAPDGAPVLLDLLIGGILYCTIIVLFVYLFPQIAGLSRVEISKYFSRIKL